MASGATIPIGSPKITPRVSWFRAVASAVFLLITILACLTSLFTLIRRLQAERLSLSNSTLIVSPQDIDTLTLVPGISALNPHFLVLRIDDLSSQRAIMRLTGETRFSTPMLIVPGGKGVYRYSGQRAVFTILEPLFSNTNKFVAGERAVFTMIGIAVFCFLFSREIMIATAFLPFLAVVSFLGLPGTCLWCTTGNDALAAVAPIIGLTYALLAHVLISRNLIAVKGLAIGFLVVSACLSFGQLVLIALQPKFCPSCLVFFTVVVAYLFSMLGAVACGKEYRFIRLPNIANHTLALMLVLLIARNTLILFGFVKLDGLKPHVSPNFVGRSLAGCGKRQKSSCQLGVA